MGMNEKRLNNLENIIKVWWSNAKFRDADRADRLFGDFLQGSDKYLSPFRAEDFREDASSNWERIKNDYGLTTQTDRQQDLRDYEEKAERWSERRREECTDGGSNQYTTSDSESMTDENVDEWLSSAIEGTTSDTVWGIEFFQRYLEAGDKRSFENKHLHTGLAIALVSQAVGDSYFYTGDSKNTTRVHPMIIQSSGTGKDPAFDFARVVARMAGLDMVDVNDVTNAGLVGTFRDGEANPGVAKTDDIIGFREATTLFRSAMSDHSQNLGENLNQILDGKKIRRNMADGTLSYRPSCTLVGTSYPPDDLDLQRLMKNGTLARFLYFFRPRDSDFPWVMAERLIEESITPTDEEERLERITELGNTLAKINDEFEGGKQFEISEEVKQIDVTDDLREIYEEYDNVTKDIVTPAITRYNLHFLRLSCLMAAVDHCSTDVTETHAEQAKNIVKESWRNLLEFYQQEEGGEKEDDAGLTQSTLDIMKALLEEDGLTQTELAGKASRSKRTIRNQDTLLEEEGIIEIREEGRAKKYYLSKGDND